MISLLMFLLLSLYMRSIFWCQATLILVTTPMTVHHILLEMVQKKQWILWKMSRMVYFASLPIIKWKPVLISVRNSHQWYSVKKGVPKNFTKVTGKQEILARVFSLNFVIILRTTFLQNTSGRLFLKFRLIHSCDNELSICVNNYNITNSKFEKQLSTKIDHKLN